MEKYAFKKFDEEDDKVNDGDTEEEDTEEDEDW